MYIVYNDIKGSSPRFIESKKEAFEIAKQMAKDETGIVRIYKANIIATAVVETAAIITKIGKTQPVKPEVFEAAKTKLIEKKLKKVSPVLKQELMEIAQDALPPPEEEELEALPLNARCSLDNNLAVIKKKGPTGEIAYLCADCAGSLNG